jgi:predicted RNA polymerase sigma factor
VPLDEQDRSLWDRGRIQEGTRLLQEALARGASGPYPVQAAIAALHDEAQSTEATDWVQIRELYGVLLRLADSPMARLSHAIAGAMVDGPASGLEALEALTADPRLAGSHRLEAARAHLLERAGRRAEAVAHYHRAADRTTSTPERNYLLLRAARLAEAVEPERTVRVRR